MSIIKKMRKQKAVWWARSSKDRFGRWTFDLPVEIDCRWEDTIQEYLDAQGEKHVSKATVYMDRLVSVGDRLRRGELVFDVLEDPMQMTDSYQVASFEQMPNFRATENLLIALLT